MSKANELSLANVGGVFVVLLAGMGLACLIAVFEFIWKSRKLATSENVRHSALIAKALSHTNENMFYVPKAIDREIVVKNRPVALALALAYPSIVSPAPTATTATAAAGQNNHMHNHSSSSYPPPAAAAASAVDHSFTPAAAYHHPHTAAVTASSPLPLSSRNYQMQPQSQAFVPSLAF